MAERPAFDIHTPWAEVERILQPEGDVTRGPDLEPLSSGQRTHLLTLSGSTLGPVMTPAVRAACRIYREQGREVQCRLEERRRQRILELVELRQSRDSSSEDSDSSSSSSSSPVIKARSLSRISQYAALPSQSAIPPALIHELRRNVQNPRVDEAMMRGSLYDSTQSVNTVIENPAFSPLRARSGSYTLSEPSPVFKAYLARHSDLSDMSVVSPSPLPTGAATQTPLHGSPEELKAYRDAQLRQYLNQVSVMPQVARSKPLSQVAMTVPPKPPPAWALESDLAHEDLSIASSAVQSMSWRVEELEISPRPRGDLHPVPSEPPPPQPVATFAAPEVLGSTPPSLPPPPLSPSPPPSLPPPPLSPSPPPSLPSPPLSPSPLLLVSPSPPSLVSPSPPTEPSQPPMIASHPPMLPDPTRLCLPSGVTTPSVQGIEAAVSSLAQEQKKQIEVLMRDQERQREALRLMFEQQQQQLIHDIMGAVQPVTPVSDKRVKPTPLPFSPQPQVADRSPSPVIPALAGQVRPVSTLPSGYRFPPAALAPDMHTKYCRVSALAKGHLTRRLLNTFKVQGIVESMRDTMNMALQLHREARAENRGVTAQDLELHRRLLQQLNKDYTSLHDVFFKLSTAEQMSILRLDHELKINNEHRAKSKERRISAVTQAKLAHKQQIAAHTGPPMPPSRSIWSRKYPRSTSSSSGKENQRVYRGRRARPFAHPDLGFPGQPVGSLDHFKDASPFTTDERRSSRRSLYASPRSLSTSNAANIGTSSWSHSRSMSHQSKKRRPKRTKVIPWK